MSAHARSSRSALWRRGGVAALTATLVNLALLGLGQPADASFLVPGRGVDAPSMPVGPLAVIASSLVPMLLGIAVAALVARRSRRGVRALQIAAGVVAVVSIGFPLSLDTDVATRLLLSAMHLVVGTAYVLAVQPRRSEASPPEAPAATPGEVVHPRGGM